MQQAQAEAESKEHAVYAQKGKAGFLKGNPGRQKGYINRTSATLARILDGIVVNKPRWVQRKLLELAESDDPTDRRTFWSLLGKRVPLAVEFEAKQGGSLEALILARLPSASVMAVMGGQGVETIEESVERGPATDGHPSPPQDPQGPKPGEHLVPPPCVSPSPPPAISGSQSDGGI